MTGGAGAVVGALTAKTVHKRDIKRVVLAVSVDGWDFELKHYLYSSGYFKGYLAEEAIEIGQRVRDRLLAPYSPHPAADSESLTKNLTRLAELHAKGLLSNDEFSAAKRQLLS
ncbi:MAG: SHOCT domain-containing protein [Betaproteobacteria bacterium]|nr:SHOCT domain-containing protein [Betaproteobacteria bacterium]